jgi:hypothetical protein
MLMAVPRNSRLLLCLLCLLPMSRQAPDAFWPRVAARDVGQAAEGNEIEADAIVGFL